MSLTLAEELLLLALRDEEGTVASGAQLALKFGLSGALLAELIEQGRLALDEKQRVTVVDQTPTGDELFDEALARIAKREQPRSLKDWVSDLGHGGLKDLQQRLQQRLVERGIVREEEGRVLWLFPTRHFPTINPGPEHAVIGRLRAVVLEGAAPDERTLLLASLVKASRLVNEVFPKEERKAASKAIEALAKGEAAGPAVASAVKSVEAAVMAAAIASVAVSGAHSS